MYSYLIIADHSKHASILLVGVLLRPSTSMLMYNHPYMASVAGLLLASINHQQPHHIMRKTALKMHASQMLMMQS